MRATGDDVDHWQRQDRGRVLRRRGPVPGLPGSRRSRPARSLLRQLYARSQAELRAAAWHRSRPSVRRSSTVSWATPIPRPPTATQTDAGRPGTTGKPRVRYGEQIWHGRIHTLSSLSGFVRHTQVFLDRIALCHPEPLGSTAAPRSGFRAVNQFEPVRLLKQSTSPDRESRCPVLAGGRRSRDHVVA